jgi:hypothetical protein
MTTSTLPNPIARHTATRTVAVMWRATPSDHRKIRYLVGDGSLMEDGRRAVDPEVVVMRPASPQTLRAIRRRFPRAEVVMLDTDWKTAALLRPALVDRAFAAGADRYVIAVDGMPVTEYRPARAGRSNADLPRRGHPPLTAAA